ncbi:MAG: MotA/TolQ/ExbB proton channel family protein [Spirochaetales bacterium]|nr:MotA/TolQ/ExbB proton channel family protein [Spirochaetales bacterium]
MTLKELLELGGWAVWPLMVFSIITVALIIERSVYLAIHHLKAKEIRDSILEFIANGEKDKAIEFCRNASSRKLGAKVFLAGLLVYELGEHRMERAMETEATERINGLESGFDLLVAVGSIAPITGFLGTVSGMIGAFKSIANAADVNAQLVAGGIFEALITTAFGLIIAIVAITAYNVFAHIVDKFAAEVEEGGSNIVTQILVQEKKGL